MLPETQPFEVFPKIVPADQKATITIRPRFEHSRFSDGVLYQAAIYPREEAGFPDASAARQQVGVYAQGGVLKVRGDFSGEQEYVIVITPSSKDPAPRSQEFHIYAVRPDLFERRPYRGDFHIHSSRSDGCEVPAYVAAACRGIGMDFMAVTDHHRYAPSLEAIQAFAGLPVDLRIYPGEEVHPPENPVHMINFGGRLSINDLFEGKAYLAEVSRIESRLSGLKAGALRYQYASCLWVYDQIRRADGLAIFCHPYWLFQKRYHVPEILIERHFAELPFDAFELIGGYHRHEFESNLLQVARYHEERGRGRSIPIVGSSDAHGCNPDDLFGWYSTLLFAHSAELPEIIAGVKECWALAMQALPGENVRFHGPFRLVKYAHYLQREVLPLHDALCQQEGRWMLAHLAGEKGAVDGLHALQGQTAALYERLWARA